MKFIAILISLLIERYWEKVQDFRDIDGFQKYCLAIRRGFGQTAFFDGWIGVVGLLLLPALVVNWLQHVLANGVLVVFGLAFATVVLLACIGPKNLNELFKQYIEASRANDTVSADKWAGEIIESQTLPAFAEQRHAMVLTRVFGRFNDWLPAVLFWFVIAGPAGAVLFRLIWVARACCERSGEQSGFAAATGKLYGLVAWLPARLSAFALAIAGNMSGALDGWRHAALRGDTPWYERQNTIVAQAGAGALNLDTNAPVTDQALQAALDLLRRTVIVWLVAIAVLTIVGWIH